MFASNQFVYSNAGILRLSELVPANITFESSFDIPIDNNIKIQSLTSATPLYRLRSGETTQIRSIRIQEGRGLRRVRVAVDAALAETYWNNWFASDVFQEGLVARRCVVVRELSLNSRIWSIGRVGAFEPSLSLHPFVGPRGPSHGPGWGSDRRLANDRK